MNWTEEKINQTIADIKKKASEDEDFRKQCLDNPNEAIKQISGMEVPDGVKINIIENDTGVDHTLILPPKEAELSKQELDRIAGGRRAMGGLPGS
jgi:hypothetical protein